MKILVLVAAIPDENSGRRKGLGSGFPVGALVVSSSLAANIKMGDLGSTFGGGPMACAAVQGTLETLRAEKICEHVQKISESLITQLQSPIIEEIRGRGLLLGLRVRALPGVEKSAEWLQTKLLERGIITGTSGNKHVLRLLPPLIIGEQDVAELVAAIKAISDTVSPT